MQGYLWPLSKVLKKEGSTTPLSRNRFDKRVFHEFLPVGEGIVAVLRRVVLGAVSHEGQIDLLVFSFFGSVTALSERDGR